MAMGRLNRPGIMVYGGTIKPGFTHFGAGDEKRDIVSAFQCYGEFLAGKISEESARKSSAKVAPVPVLVAACTPPTRWPRPSKRWG